MDVRLRTLGRTELISDERLPPGLTSGRPLLLLIYLALNPERAFERSHLIELLWGDHQGEGAARRAFRQALYLVRRALPAGTIEADAQRAHLARRIPSDAVELETALRARDAEAVTELCRGRFLEGLTVDAPAAFQQWVDRQRTGYERRVRALLLEAAEEALAAGAADSAVQFLEAVERIDGFDLGSELRKVEAWERLGHGSTAAAIAHRALEHCDELDLPVPPETRARLEATLARPSDSPEIERDASVPTAPGFIGRTRERAQLVSAWMRAAGGEGLTALVLGDPGIGKSRLISEVMAQARADGAVVLEGRSYALESHLLYGALIEVLRQSLDVPGFAGVGEVWLSELSRLLPELHERYPTLPAPRSDEPGGRRRFYEAVAQVFESLAYERPVFCMLDDLHWADEATLELLHYLGRRLCASQILFVAGIRPGEASGTLRKLQATLAQEHGGLLVELGPLAEDATRELVSSMFGHRHLPPALPRLVWRSSEGNPFFAVSMVEALVARGCASVAGADVNWAEECAEGVPRVPERVKELIEARLAVLPMEEASVLRTGAVAGRFFTTGILASVTGQNIDEIEALMSSLIERRLIRRRRTDGESAWEFTHDRIREVVYESVPEDVRSTLHSEVARSEAALGSNVGPASAARHADLAGDRVSAFHHALEAGRWARSVFAFEGARDMLRVALANAPDDAARALVNEELARLPTPTRSTASAGSRALTRLRAWWPAAALLVIVTAAFVWKEVPHASTPIQAPAFPTGLLVRVDDNGVDYLGVFDPRSPERPIRRLPRRALPEFKRRRVGRPLLSPNGKWVAAAVTRPGERPDVYAFRSDGSDSMRLTTNPDDDAPLAWFPDGRSVLIQSGVGAGTPDYAYHLFVATLNGKAPRPITPDSLRGKWWFCGSAAVSPSGTRIAADIGGDQSGLWIMDADGSNARRLARFSDHVNGESFSPDGTQLAFFHDRNRRLVILSLKTGARVTTDLPEAAIHNSLFWSAHSRTIFFSANVDGNSEIFSVGRDGSGLTRVTYSNPSEVLVGRLGPRPPYVARVNIIASTRSTRPMLVGDSIPVTAVAHASGGTVLEGVDIRMYCLASDVCDVSNGWLHGRGPGSSLLLATAGGWRADTLSVHVFDATPTLEFSEDWNSGIDPAKWQVFGEPSPVVVPHGGRGDSGGFQANGDSEWASGVITRRAFSDRRGLTLDFWGRGSFRTRWPSWQWLQAGFTGDSLTRFTGDGPFPQTPVAVSVKNNKPGEVTGLLFMGPPVAARPVMGDPSDWHRFTVQIFPDGHAELWVDGRFVWRERESPLLPSDVRVVLYGRATNGPVIEDDVRVYEGILLGR